MLQLLFLVVKIFNVGVYHILEVKWTIQNVIAHEGKIKGCILMLIIKDSNKH